MNYTKKEIYRYWWTIAIMMYIMYINVMHKWGHQGDMTCWMDWAKYMRINGLTKIYDNTETRCDYFPAYLYILWLHGKIQGSMQNLQDNLYTIKWFTLIFDFLGAFLAVWYVKEPVKKVALFIFLMLNIAYIYNTVQWAQVDAIFTFFGFAAVIAALEKKVSLSIVSFMLCINFKLQAIVFVPVLGLILLPQILSKKGIQQLFIGLFFGLLIQLAILFPFIVKGKLDKVWHVFTHLAGQYPYPSLCAFNIWFWFFPNTTIEGMYELNDGVKLGFLTLRQIGNLMFLVMMLATVFPLMKYEYQTLIEKKILSFPLEKIFLMCALVPLCFFYFNTEMHDRYTHPALIALAAYAFCSVNKLRYIPLILGSVAYLLNLEKPLRVMALTNYETLIFDPKFGAVLWGILIMLLFYLLYSRKIDTNEELILHIQ